MRIADVRTVQVVHIATDETIRAADDICAALGAQLAKLGRALTREQPMREMQLRN